MVTAMRAEATFPEVLHAVLTLVENSDGEIDGYRVYHEARVALNIDGSQSSRELRRTWAKFTGQVARALNRLADEGVLIKVGAGARGPDGTYALGREVRWYTRAGWDRARSRGQARQDDRQREAQRWTAIRGYLAAANIIASSELTTEPRLTQDQWEALLARLERTS